MSPQPYIKRHYTGLFLTMFIFMCSVTTVNAQFNLSDDYGYLPSWPNETHVREVSLATEWFKIWTPPAGYEHMVFESCFIKDSIDMCVGKNQKTVSLLGNLWREYKEGKSQSASFEKIKIHAQLYSDKTDSIREYAHTGMDWPTENKVAYAHWGSSDGAFYPCCSYFKWFTDYEIINKEIQQLRGDNIPTNTSGSNNPLYDLPKSSKPYFLQPKSYINKWLLKENQLQEHLRRIATMGQVLADSASVKDSILDSALVIDKRLLKKHVAGVYLNVVSIINHYNGQLDSLYKTELTHKNEVTKLHAKVLSLKKMTEELMVERDSIGARISFIQTQKERIIAQLDSSLNRMEQYRNILDSLYRLCPDMDATNNCPAPVNNQIRIYYNRMNTEISTQEALLTISELYSDSLVESYNHQTYIFASLDSTRTVLAEVKINFEDRRGAYYKFKRDIRPLKIKYKKILDLTEFQISTLRKLKSEMTPDNSGSGSGSQNGLPPDFDPDDLFGPTILPKPKFPQIPDFLPDANFAPDKIPQNMFDFPSDVKLDLDKLINTGSPFIGY